VYTQPLGASEAVSAYPFVAFLAGYWYYVNSEDPTKIWKSSTIAGLSSTAATVLTGVVLNGFISAVNGVLVSGANISGGGSYLAHSLDGETWEYFDGTISPVSAIYQKEILFSAGLPLVISGTDNFRLLDYTPTSAPDTFSISYPAEGEAPAPWQYYVRAFQ
jgi:hypothetical protein